MNTELKLNIELKFRLIDKHGKVVGFEKWYTGESDEESGWLYSKDGQRWDQQPIPHSCKDQYTGLLDKNNNPIYTRDTVKFRNYKETIIGLVEYRDMVVGYVSHFTEDEYGYHEEYERKSICTFQHHITLEKIGNIDENQEQKSPNR